ncbi:MAG TPA: hypothetical protein VE054_06670 [Blattabacteriaceae bacterium]|nr:hypothetical protein [Blattabacteriaceae bacterium]
MRTSAVLRTLSWIAHCYRRKILLFGLEGALLVYSTATLDERNVVDQKTAVEYQSVKRILMEIVAPFYYIMILVSPREESVSQIYNARRQEPAD